MQRTWNQGVIEFSVIKYSTINDAWSQPLHLAKRWLISQSVWYNTHKYNTVISYKEWGTKTVAATVSCRQPFVTASVVGPILECSSPNYIPFSLAPQVPIIRVMENNKCKGLRSSGLAEKYRGFPLLSQIRPIWEKHPKCVFQQYVFAADRISLKTRKYNKRKECRH